MGMHPNVILMVVLTPDDLSRKTMRGILAVSGKDGVDDEVIKIVKKDYNYLIMESDYDEVYQISAKEGDLVFFDMVTYGYGEVIDWDVLEVQKKILDTWARKICREFACSYVIKVTANHW